MTEAAVRYVWKDNPNTAVPPYTGGWAEAAANIQDAVDVAQAGDTVLVTNGVYNVGGRVAPGDTTLKTRVVVTNAITIVSVNGPEGTLIVGAPHTAMTYDGLGDSAVRGVYLTNSAVLSGFTVTNGFTRYTSSTAASHFYGGGIRCESAAAIVSNCIITANMAAMRGGGVYSGTLIDCQVITNIVRASSTSAGGGGTYGASCRGTRFFCNQTLGSNTDGGGAYAGAFEACSFEANRSARDGGGVYTPSVLTNCVVESNTAVRYGGGVYKGVVAASRIEGNRATGASGQGGGFWGNANTDMLRGCQVSGNEATDYGGGIYCAMVYDCLIRSNRVTASGSDGGGFYGGAAYELQRCRILANEAVDRGGGVCLGKLFSCVVSGNRAANGGGFYGGSGYFLASCTVMDNTATTRYGGAYNTSGKIGSSIVYANAAPEDPNWYGGAVTNSCVDPLPSSGAGNTNFNPLVSGYADPHLLPGSPLIGKGLVEAWMTDATDIDGEARAADGLTDMGADQRGTVFEGPLSVSISAATNVCAVAWPHRFRAEATGMAGGMAWDFGDGATAADVNPAGHAYATTGVYTVAVTVTNGTHTANATYEITVTDYMCYVSPSGRHIAPFETWENAATNIQEAADAVALAGGRVVVTNGIYSAGGRVVSGQTVTNRLVLDKAVRVESVNGPEETAIVGRWNSESVPLGALAVRGVYVGPQAVLAGFTVANSATVSSTSGNSGRGGGLFLAAGGVATNCAVSNCRAWAGGGAASEAGLAGALFGCTLCDNAALTVSVSGGQGGGAYACVLEGCLLTDNTASYQGGGTYDSVAVDCELRGNTATSGGGAYSGTLRRCRVFDNTAAGTGSGGGAYDAALYSCVLSGNTAYQGGGAYGATVTKGMFSCTVVGNTATVAGSTPGGGGFYCGNGTNYTVRNCIVYHNAAAVSNNLYRGTIQYTCATPLPSGPGNISEPPLVASFERPALLPGSPCAGAGLVEGWMDDALDFEGEARMTGETVDIGADELHTEGLTGPLSVSISGPAWPYFPSQSYTFEAVVEGHPTVVRWDFGDGQEAVNAAQVTHAWPEGDYTLRLTVSNATHSAEATLLLSVAPDTRYVSLSGSHTPPFRTWGTAATNLQAAADAVLAGGRVKVAAGVYDCGGRPASGQTLTNRLYVSGAVEVIAEGGPGVTFIVGAASGAAFTNGLGAGAVRGVYLSAGASLSGFTVTSGHTLWSATATGIDYLGGGVACYDSTCVVHDCVVSNCAAAAAGGGVYQGVVRDSTIGRNAVCGTGSGSGKGGGVYDPTLLSNCVVRANTSYGMGGGVYTYGGVAVDCVIDGNAVVGAAGGGGFYGDNFPNDVLRNCTVVNNSAPGSGGGVYGALLYDCLLTNNAAGQNGGGFAGSSSALSYRCRFIGNSSAGSGGGAYYGRYYRCRLLGNAAGTYGGGVYNGTLYSSVISGNSAGLIGGGSRFGTLEACTVLGNTAANGGGTSLGEAYSCLIYYNMASVSDDNWSGTGIWQCCTVPAYGGDDVADAPQVSGFYDAHLLPGSPCIDKGLNLPLWMYSLEGLDLDEETRIVGARTDIGADERDEATLDGPLSVGASVDLATFGLMYAPEFRAEAVGKVGDLIWDFGDGMSVTNQNPVRHAFSGAGDYTVRVTVTNLTGGATAEVAVTVVLGYVYVDLSGGHVAPFGSWAAAATNIQDAVDAAIWGGTVWVTNGTYALGGRADASGAWLSRVCAEQPLVLRSVDGAAETVIQGAWHDAGTACGPNAVRGVFLKHDQARLEGFTVTGGATDTDYTGDGGGVYCAATGARVSGCVITNCVAYDEGGGAWGGAWENCQLLGNSADWGGGGAAQCSLSNCVIAGNVGNSYAGGVYEGTLTDCRLTANATYGDGGGTHGGAYGGSLERCAVSGNTASGRGGGACYAWLTDSVLEGNRAGGDGGGASDCWGDGCAFIANTATGDGGGAYWGYFSECRFEGNASESGNGGGYATSSSYDWLNACAVVNNRAAQSGGGCYGGVLSDCLLTNNTAQSGGGYYVPLIDAFGELKRCRVRDNRASAKGGGVYGGTLYSSVVACNSAGHTGGGTYGSTLESCSVLGNAAGQQAGGCQAGVAYNSIIYHNRAVWEPDMSDTLCENCCTPGIGTVTVPPHVAGFREPHLLPWSPCIDAGAYRDWMAYEWAMDMDREARVMGASTDIGADEAMTTAPAGPLAITVFAVPLSVMPGTAQEFRAEITGFPSGLVWDFGDGAGATDVNPASHAFAEVGTYTVRVTATNGTGSVFAELQITVGTGDVFVALTGTHEPPFATWETAATNIQDAVDAAPSGGTVHVADGTYDLGGRPAMGQALTNRVCIETAVTVRGENGPSGVIVRGARHAPETACGAGAVRGVYLGHRDARLCGVTVSGGATLEAGETDGGGVFSAFSECAASNCVVNGCAAAGNGGGCYSGSLFDCLLTGNAALNGGGYHMASSEGAYGELYRCRVWENQASEDGGGAYGGTLYSCVVSGNAAGWTGGGTLESALESCSLLGNTAAEYAGGSYAGTAYNSIIYHNRAPAGQDAADTVCENCCTPEIGSVAEPPRVSGFREPHLLPVSPCIDAGVYRGWMAESFGLDMDGEARVAGASADIGADETGLSTPVGPLVIELFTDSLTVVPGRSQEFRAEISGLASNLVWDFGDGTGAINENPVSHAFGGTGVFTVRATAANGTGSAFAERQITVGAGDLFVALTGTHEPPYATWETAATNIQDAVDAAPWGGTVRIADGTYELGGRPAAGQSLANRVCVEKPVTVRGENGPAGVIVCGAWHAPETACGAGAVRGVYLGHREARLVGVTVTGGATSDAGETDGGGVYCAFGENTASNCVVTSCVASGSGGGCYGGVWLKCQISGNTTAGLFGGGLAFGNAFGCTLSGNMAGWYGGGLAFGSMGECTVSGNTSGWYGGGVAYGNAVRCTVSDNRAGLYGGGAYGGSLVSCRATGNQAEQAGGAAYAELNNCTVSANTARTGVGGAGWCTLANSIVWDNVAPVATNALESTFDHCLTWPLPEGAYDAGGNLDADPQFVDPATGDYRLAATSPCVNAGTNMPWIVGATDLDGRARFVDGIVDMGAYEYAPAGGVAALGTPIDWLDDYFGGPDWDAVELDDPDRDGFPTWKEFVALTNPTDGFSFFAVRGVAYTADGVDVSFDTSVGRVYTVQHSPGLVPTSWSDAAASVAGDGGRMTVQVPDTGGAFFYRVRVDLP